MKTIKAFSLGLLALSLFTGCASKDANITNQTALFWHNKIYQDVVNRNFDDADDKFTSLEVEHPNSNYIPVDLLILANAHLKNGEFQLSKFYINEYETRYASNYEKEWCEYQKAKISFLSLNNPYTNQKSLDDTLKLVHNVINTYPNSIYIYELNTMKTKLEDTQIVFDNNIASLYKRLDKPKASKLYERKETQKIIPPHIPWYKNLFYW